MARSDDTDQRRLQRRNDMAMVMCALIAVGMVGASFAAVPLYRLFCQATGYNGTTRVAKTAPGAVDGRIYTIRFDSNVNGLNWHFVPEQSSLKVRAGEKGLAYFKAVSHEVRATSGSAIYNVTPELAGRYFNKIQCFCFNEQTLAAGQSVDMPVTFFVDPEIFNDPDMKTVRTITLSYTFFPAGNPAPDAADAAGDHPAIRVGAAEAGAPRSAN